MFCGRRVGRRAPPCSRILIEIHSIQTNFSHVKEPNNIVFLFQYNLHEVSIPPFIIRASFTPRGPVYF